MDFEEEALLWLLLRRKKRRRRNRLFWVHPITERKNESQFKLLYDSLRKYDDKFFDFFRMNKNTFDYILSHLKSSLQREDTNMRKSIQPEERLAITLR